MKNAIKSAMPIAALFFLTACGNNETSDKQTEDQDTTKMDQMSNENAGSSASLKDEKLNGVYQHYIHLTTALTNHDVAEAKIAANAIEAGAKELEGGGTIASSASKITNAGDIEAQRAAYSTLSNEFISRVKKSGLTKGELYVDYCPMAFDNKGAYWLSNQKGIRNPYFGDKMMTCGEITETVR